MAKPKKPTSKPSKPTSASVVLQPVINIALDKLVLSDANVRQVKDGLSIESLADSIARRGLLQSLSVRAAFDSDGTATGRYEVQAGGRRLRALQLLAKQKCLAKDAPIACIVKAGGMAEDDSLAENSDRLPLHPLDQFRAFAKLRAKGQGEEEIAAAFNVTVGVVRQRLRLASASPVLLAAYEAEDIDLDQLMAFCVTTDHARQNQVLEGVVKNEVPGFPHNIRRLLTETAVSAGDHRAVFVGLDAYTKAGGAVMRDLFEADEGGWLLNPDILQRLVSEKLAAARDALLADGWKWVIAAEDIPYAERRTLRAMPPLKDGLTKKEQARQEALSEEYDAIVAELPDDNQVDDGAEALRQRLTEVERELAELSNKPPRFAPEDKARAGALVSITHYGQLAIEYGFIRPEDAMASDPGLKDGCEDDEAGEEAETTEETGLVEEPQSPLPDRLVEDLTSYRTAALRDALAGNFEVAFLAGLHALCLSQFYPSGSISCLQLRVIDNFVPNIEGFSAFDAARRNQERDDIWSKRLPEDPKELWGALVDLDAGARAELFAHCVAASVNAVRDAHRQRRDELRHADVLAAALGLDMAQAGWTTSAANYLARITKAQILEAVREAKGEATVQLIAHLKKPEMAKEAERLLQGTAWLPEPLRAPVPVSSATTAEGEAPLPAFLDDGGDQRAAAA